MPQEITSKRGLMLWLLENLGKQWSKISCAKALEKLAIEDNSTNRHKWYDLKSEWKRSLQKSEGDSKYQKPRLSFHNFNEASVFLSSVFTLKVRRDALGKGWRETRAKNKFIIWKSRHGWIKWFLTGRCLLHVKKPVHDGKILQLLADGFFNSGLLQDIKEFTAFYRSFYLKAVKLTAHLGKESRIPRFQIEFDNGYNKLVVANDESHPHDIELQYYLLRDGERLKEYLKDSQRTLDYNTETNLRFTEFLNQLMAPKQPPKNDRMVV